MPSLPPITGPITTPSATKNLGAPAANAAQTAPELTAPSGGGLQVAKVTPETFSKTIALPARIVGIPVEAPQTQSSLGSPRVLVTEVQDLGSPMVNSLDEIDAGSPVAGSPVRPLSIPLNDAIRPYPSTGAVVVSRFASLRGGTTDGSAPASNAEAFAADWIFSSANGNHGSGDVDHWHANVAGTSPGLPLQVAEIGGIDTDATEFIRGFAEFDIAGKADASEAILKFKVYDVTDVSGVGVGGLFGQVTAYDGVVVLEAYTADNQEDLTDINEASLGTLGTINTSGAVVQQEYSLDVTTLYNSAATSFGVRLKTQTEPLATVKGITFYDFRLEIDGGGNSDLAARFNENQGAAGSYLYANIANYRSGDSAGSFSCWFKSTSTKTLNYLFASSQSSGTSYLGFLLYGATGRVGIYDGTNDVVTSTGGFNDGNWHHLVIVSSGSAWTIYIDGGSMALTVNAGANNGNWWADYASRNIVTIGGIFRSGAIDGTANADIDEVAVWSAQLTATNVNELFTSGQGILMTDVVSGSVVLTGSVTPVNSWPLNYNSAGGMLDDASSTLNLTNLGQVFTINGIDAGALNP